MGWNATWIAVRGKDRDKVLLDFGLARTGSFVSFPTEATGSLELVDGWFLVFFLAEQERYTSDDSAALVSTGGEALVCHVHEGIMVSQAAHWIDGQRLWRVVHEPENGTSNLIIKGAIPPCFTAIRERLSAQEALEHAQPMARSRGTRPSQLPPDLLQLMGERGVLPLPGPVLLKVSHMFDAPVALCAELTGFRHDRVYGNIGDKPFERLESIPRRSLVQEIEK